MTEPLSTSTTQRSRRPCQPTHSLSRDRLTTSRSPRCSQESSTSSAQSPSPTSRNLPTTSPSWAPTERETTKMCPNLLATSTLPPRTRPRPTSSKPPPFIDQCASFVRWTVRIVSASVYPIFLVTVGRFSMNLFKKILALSPFFFPLFRNIPLVFVVILVLYTNLFPILNG